MTARHLIAQIPRVCAECEHPFLAKRETARFCTEPRCVTRRKNRANDDARKARKAAAERAISTET